MSRSSPVISLSLSIYPSPSPSLLFIHHSFLFSLHPSLSLSPFSSLPLFLFIPLSLPFHPSISPFSPYPFFPHFLLPFPSLPLPFPSLSLPVSPNTAYFLFTTNTTANTPCLQLGHLSLTPFFSSSCPSHTKGHPKRERERETMCGYLSFLNDAQYARRCFRTKAHSGSKWYPILFAKSFETGRIYLCST